MDEDRLIKIPPFLTEGEASGAESSRGEYEVEPAAICIPAQEMCGEGCLTYAERCAAKCQTACETGCEDECQTACQVSCQGCQTGCEVSGQAPTGTGSLSVTGVTSTSISVRLTAIPRATYYEVWCREDGATGFDEDSTTGLTYTFTGLKPGTTYILNYAGRNSYGNGPTMASGVRATTLPAIDPWSWTSSNGSATAAQTVHFYNVVTRAEEISPVSHLVWNDLVDKIVEVQMAAGRSWTGRAVEQCKVSAGDTLSATIYNAVRANVDALSSTGIASVSPDDDELTGNHIVGLTDALNSFIGAM